MVSNGGALYLLKAHVHDFDNPSVKRGLDDESDVLEVDGFGVHEVVGSLVVVLDGA